MASVRSKGEANRKNGNPYLAWAFMEAAHFAVRYLPEATRFYERKCRQRHPILAKKALAHKLARACYYILRDEVPFARERGTAVRRVRFRQPGQAGKVPGTTTILIGRLGCPLHDGFSMRLGVDSTQGWGAAHERTVSTR